MVTAEGNTVIDTTVTSSSYTPSAPLANGANYQWTVTSINAGGQQTAAVRFTASAAEIGQFADSGALPMPPWLEARRRPRQPRCSYTRQLPTEIQVEIDAFLLVNNQQLDHAFLDG